ncbi:lysostaphin resistance A-like protein [Haloferax sp. S1W]|uniref:lysostaphin resistance A-like protein n=1 Tax=Haloferax sp. S1W TaxID=3377110 RepID=UPI0037C64995
MSSSAESTAARAGIVAHLRAVAVAIALVVTSLLLGIVLTLAVFVPLVALGIPLAESPSVVLLAALIPSQLAFATVGILATVTLLDGVPVRVPTRHDLQWVGLGLLGSFGAVSLLVVASTFVDLSPLQSVVGDAAEANPGLLVALALLSIVVIAPAEELLFRGAVQGRLRATFGPVGAIGLASALFASLHVFNFVGGGVLVLVPLATLFLVGAVLGTVYERTDNLVAPIAVHALYNATLFLSTLVTG